MKNTTIDPKHQNTLKNVCEDVPIKTFILATITTPKYAKFPSNQNEPPLTSKGIKPMAKIKAEESEP